MSNKKTIKQDSEFASSLINALTGTGTGQDSRTAGFFAYGPQITSGQANALYTTTWMGRKIVDIPAEDMTKAWRTIHAPDLTQDKIKRIIDVEKQLKIKTRILTAIKWARLFGGSLLVLGVRDGLKLSEPLDPETIGEGDLEFVQVLDMYRAGVQDINTWNPFADNYLDPEYYSIFGHRVHNSRVIKFIGLETTYETISFYNYFGISVLQPIYESIRDAMQALAGASNLTMKASQDVMKTSSLWEFVGTNDEKKITDRFALMQAQRSILNMLVLDKEEEFESVSATYSGLDAVLDKLLNMVVGASDIPATRFFGQSPKGFNATGESDMRNYYDKVKSDQENTLRPRLEMLDEVMVRSAIGEMPEDYTFEFDSLWQPTVTERSEIEVKQIEKLKGLWELGVPTEVLLKDAMEMGLSKNLTEEVIKEFTDEPDIDEGTFA